MWQETVNAERKRGRKEQGYQKPEENEHHVPFTYPKIKRSAFCMHRIADKLIVFLPKACSASFFSIKKNHFPGLSYWPLPKIANRLQKQKANGFSHSHVGSFHPAPFPPLRSSSSPPHSRTAQRIRGQKSDWLW